MSNITYTAPPLVASFMRGASFGRLIAGPVGSGKTTGCLFELFRRACEQEPAPDGLRYTRFAIVRQTLKQLKDTVLKDIVSWLKGMASYKVSDNTIYLEIGDVRSEWLLIPLDDPQDQARLLSMQLTGAWMSECIEMNADLIPALSGRCGRYPSAVLGGCTWSGLIADTNMPTEGSDWHTLMTVPPSDWAIFVQPGGLTPQAENLEWLNQTSVTLTYDITDPRRIAQGRLYYERLERTSNADWVTRYVHAKYGNDPSGSAVFRESFKRSFHVVPDLKPVAGHPLLVGQDFGRDPWSIITQLDHRGRLLVLEEVEAEDIGLELHLQRNLRPRLMQARYFGLPIAIVGDPSGVSKSSIYEETTFDVLRRMGFMAFPAPTNDIDPRLRAVDAFLLEQRDGGPAILFDGTRCPKLVQGMSGGYRYAKTRTGQRKPLPDKNDFSHGNDSLQYACLTARPGSMINVIGKRLRGGGVKKPQGPVSAAGWT